MDSDPQDLNDYKRRLRALISAGTALTSSWDLTDVLKTVNRELAEIFNARRCSLLERLQDDTLVLLAEYGPHNRNSGSDRGSSYQLAHHTLVKKVLAERQAVRMTGSQVALEPAEQAYLASFDNPSLLWLPMVFKDKVVGLIEIANFDQERRFSQEEITIAQLLANQAAGAIENARLYREMEQRLREQTTLRKAGAALSASLDLHEVLTLLSEQFCAAAVSTSAYICTYDRNTHISTVIAEYFSPLASAKERVSDLGEIYIEERTDFINAGLPEQYHVDDPDLNPNDRANLLQYGGQSVLIFPIQYLGQTTAFAEIWDSREKRVFSTSEIQLCQGIAQQAAIAIENARLYEQVQQELAERKKLTGALKESEARYALATRGANDGLWDWDLRRDEIYFSPRWAAMLGLEEVETLDKPDFWFQRIHPEDREQLHVDLDAHFEGTTDHFENEHRMQHKDGSYRWVLTRGLAVRTDQGEVYRMAGSQTDITERKRAEDQLLHDAFHDALTGLPNRALFIDRLGRAIERMKRRPDDLFAVLFLDLDRFKVINDSLGHSAGDLLLIAIARRLEVYLRSVDTVARLGGDEFVILLEDLETGEDAAHVAERLQEELNSPFTIQDNQIFVTVSIGIVPSTTTYDRPEEIIRDADIAMYQAKAHGRARHQIFTSTMRTQAKARMELENELRQAIGLQQFRVYFQPIISLDNDRITGFEALVRWQHPKRGFLTPDAFIHVAEETGLIIPIDWWVLWESCQKLIAWQAEYPADPPLTMSVNLSGKHFAQLDLLDQISNILKATELKPESLILEITENTIIENTVYATRLISKLRSLGVQVQIDDFGTGYSSLSYLQRYPIDAIKIDRSFISKMPEGTNHAEIVRTIVTLARELGMQVIAEGVETETQLNQLRELDCNYGQGFLISKPLDGDMTDKLLRSISEANPSESARMKTPGFQRGASNRSSEA